MFAPKKILVPTDFSLYSDLTMKDALDIAEQYDAKLVLLHVIDENIRQCAADYCLGNEIITKLEEEGLKQSKDKLHKAADEGKRSKKLDISYEVKKGIPAEIILDEQMSHGIDLIIMASHGKTGILKQLIGRKTDKVVRAAKYPVIVVRT